MIVEASLIVPVGYGRFDVMKGYFNGEK